MFKKFIVGIIIVLVVIFVGLIIFVYPIYSKMMKTETLHIDKALTIVLGGGGNSGILVTDSAVVVIDTKMGKPAGELAKMAKDIAGMKKIIVINTHFHPDHINGNKFYQESNIYMGSYDKGFLLKNLKHELLPSLFVTDSLTLALGKDTVQLINVGQGHTMDDVIVYLKSRKLLFSGDLIINKTNPVLNDASNPNVDKWIKVLDLILAKDIKTIVPGHGNLGGKELASALKQYFEDMKTAASDPTKASELKAKYKDWAKVPIMASPDKTISFIKSK